MPLGFIIFFAVVVICFAWLWWAVANAEVLPPDFDYDKYVDDLIEKDKETKGESKPDHGTV